METFEFSLNPDRKRMELFLVIALLVKGRSILDNSDFAVGALDYAKALSEFGLNYEVQGHQLVFTGVGFGYKAPTILPINFCESKLIFLWTLASKDTEQIYTFAKSSLDNEVYAQKLLQQYFKVNVVESSSQIFSFTFLENEPSIKKDSLGNVAYIMRNRLLLRALVRSEYLSFEERFSVCDQFTKMLIYFGVKSKYEIRGLEQLSELERRIMISRGKKIERVVYTEICETQVITGRNYYIPCDIFEAFAVALLVTISSKRNVPKICIKNVDLNVSSSGAISNLKRMGANIENGSKRERFGDIYGDILVEPLGQGKRLQGRRFSEDSIATCIEEYPLLSVAACFAEGETILRLPKEHRNQMRSENESLAINLRKTGAEVGVYDDGLVIRGIETITNENNFSSQNLPQNTLALALLSIALQNKETIEDKTIEYTYPSLLKKMKMFMDYSNEKF